MTDRAKFISGVTTSLGHSEVHTPSPEPATAFSDSDEDAKLKAAAALAVATDRASELIEQMAKAAENTGWQVHRVSNLEDAAELIADICRG